MAAGCLLTRLEWEWAWACDEKPEEDRCVLEATLAFCSSSLEDELDSNLDATMMLPLPLPSFLSRLVLDTDCIVSVLTT